MENKDLTFEAALARLEEITGLLENGNSPLDESLTLFEEGVRLVKFCNGKLDTAEQKVKILMSGDNGTTEKDFNGNA